MVAKHGGFRKGAGRPKGSRNRATIARETRQHEALAVARAEDASLMPIDFLLRVLRDPTTPLGRRTAVAKLVTRYLKVHLAEQVICGQGGTVLVRTITDRPSGDAMDAKPIPIARRGTVARVPPRKHSGSSMGGTLGTGIRGCTNDSGGIALARSDAEGDRRARVGCDARHPGRSRARKHRVIRQITLAAFNRT